MRRKAANLTGADMAEQLSVIAAAEARTTTGDLAAEARSMVEEGRSLLASVAALAHEEISRRDFDKKAVLDWVARARKLRPALAASEPGPAWKPDEPSTEVIAATGVRASGVVVGVASDGWGNDRVADLKVVVRLDDTAGTTLERSLSVLAREAPREGDRVEVAYDVADTSRFVFRAAITPPSEDRVKGLAELERLYDRGLLTREEFDAEKARLLGG